MEKQRLLKLLKSVPSDIDAIGMILSNYTDYGHSEMGGMVSVKQFNNVAECLIEWWDGKADSTSEKDLRVCKVIPRFFDPERNKPLPSKNDITFSDDVFIIDEDGMHGLAYYSFEDCQWKFHTDTLVDYNEVGHETKWKWYYPTVAVEDAF